ncbi:hypothetical protein ACUXST_001052 [Sphingomonas sp. F9_3S_D5_B_2]
MEHHGDPETQVREGPFEADEPSSFPVEHRASYSASMRVIFLLSIASWLVVAAVAIAVIRLVH